ncbi:MAG: hypothetical protein GXP54_08060 [Deltaproteobacteria bacterium]|nr:hypothetical protein [Deltaproteobacteria bacterium]
MNPYYSVAYNPADSMAVDRFSKAGANEIFAAVTSRNFGSGRPKGAEITYEMLAEHFGRAREIGLKTTLLFNPACTGNREFTEDGKRELVEVARFINENSIDYVTVANPWMINAFRALCPDAGIKISSHYNCDDWGKFRLMLEHLKADIVIVSQFANKNFRLLRQVIREYGADRLEIMCTVPCMAGCPYRTWHADAFAHADEAPLPEEANQFPCVNDIVSNPNIAISSQFIRREDLSYYLRLGIDKFKIGERFAPNFLNANCIDYYHGGPRTGLWDIIGKEFGGAGLKRVHFERMDGFYEPFFNEECDGTKYNCNDCTHCMEYAERCLEFKTDFDPPPRGYQRDYLKGHVADLRRRMDEDETKGQ